MTVKCLSKDVQAYIVQTFQFSQLPKRKRIVHLARAYARSTRTIERVLLDACVDPGIKHRKPVTPLITASSPLPVNNISKSDVMIAFAKKHNITVVDLKLPRVTTSDCRGDILALPRYGNHMSETLERWRVSDRMLEKTDSEWLDTHPSQLDPLPAPRQNSWFRRILDRLFA